MKKSIVLVCLGFAFAASGPALAVDQQNKMKGCSKEATGMKGDERKAFMSKCLKKDYVLKSDAVAEAHASADKPAAAAASSSQQDRMKTCSSDAKAKGLKDEERKKFMSACLKG